MSHRRRNWRLRNLLATPTTVALCGFFAITVLGIPPAQERVRMVWNASASAPIGLYYVEHSHPLARGELVLAIPSPAIAQFAARRGYLPLGVPLVKRIAARAGDSVCAHNSDIFINARLVARRRTTDGKGRALPTWSGCRTLPSDQVFLLMQKVHDSFDGRYFGPTKASQIVGALDPIWTR